MNKMTTGENITMNKKILIALLATAGATGGFVYQAKEHKDEIAEVQLEAKSNVQAEQEASSQKIASVTEAKDKEIAKLKDSKNAKIKELEKKNTQLKDEKDKAVTALSNKKVEAAEVIPAVEKPAEQVAEPVLEVAKPEPAQQAPVVNHEPEVVNTSSAKEWIAQRESNGSYTANNSNMYIGRYQLSASYLNGDHSPANQERVAEKYVAERYGSWENAKSFWQANGWY